MKIFILGAGNVGYHLARKLYQYKELKVWVMNYRPNKVLEELAGMNITVLSNYDAIPVDGDVYIIAVKDQYIRSIAELLKGKVSQNAVIVHTSGATESTILQGFANYGVIYPLHSFLYTEKNIDWINIPIYLVANHSHSMSIIRKVAAYLNSDNTSPIDDTTKLQIHLLAVLGNNFINALLHAMYVISEKNIDLYRNNFHLIVQTIERARHHHPAKFQTGPAIRFDTESIEKHLQYLSSHPEIKQIYQCLTHYIQNNIAHESDKR